ncbi:hypothetical protein FQN60_006729 [Etheostoma spectabile]|uniref:Cytochrome P450 20A1 n=1 Tax=Etheostoma spectabile TaxID=54343 RepID=A0A5J5CGH2_9PERO|nr:hypothetical protein FQN60_006729 [Etheostoma spectabile]
MLDFAIFAVTFVIILVGAVLYLYPSSRRASGDGNLQDIVNKGSLHEFLVSLHQRFGSVASFWFGGRPVVSLGSVQQLRQHINPNHTTDSFETMLKSLLGYQSGMGGGATETIIRKKVYESGVNNMLKNNFPLSFPDSQHTPLCAHLLGLAMKTVTQLALGESFQDDAKVLSFCKNHDAIWSEIGKGYLDGSLEKSSSRKGRYEKALSEMESVLLSVAKERKAQRTQTAFIMEDCMVFTLAGEDVQDKLYQELVEVLGSDPVSLDKIPQLRFAYTVATVLLSTLVRQLKLHPLKGQVVEVRSELVSTPKDETWITVSRKG